MPTAQDRFSTMLTEQVAPWLKERGFKRRDSTFRREREGAWQIVNFQRSKYSEARALRFTVNLGVALDVLHEADPPWRERGWPLEYECDFRQRLGLLYRHTDKWWRIGRLRPPDRAARDVLEALERHGLEWLEVHADPERNLAHGLRDLPAVSILSLPSLVALAKRIGTAEDLAAVEGEFERRRPAAQT